MVANPDAAWALQVDAPHEHCSTLASLMRAGLGQPPVSDPLEPHTTLTLRFPQQPAASLIDQVEGWLANLGCQEASLWTRSPQDTSWLPGWRAFYQGGRPSARLAVAPPWGHADHEALCCVTLDPRGAFGSGFHVTSRQTLGLIDTLLEERGDSLEGLRALDVGSGSGLLSVMMARLGAQVVALDRSPRARRLTLENAHHNGVQGMVQVREAALEELEPFDLVVANLGPSFRLLPLLAALAGEHLLVGCLHPPLRAQALQHAAGLTPVQELLEDSWLAMRWRRTSGA